MQRLNTEHWLKAGRKIIGRKIGLTAEAVQKQLGVDQPDFGVLFDDMQIADGGALNAARVLQPKAEAEVALIMGRDLNKADASADDVAAAADCAVAAIEIVDSRIAGWDISIVDTVADNASSGMFALGGRPRRLRDIDDLRAVRMQLTANGEVVSEGLGAACLGHPVNAVVWLANELARRGAPVRAGDLILSGSLGPLVPAAAHTRYEATLDGLGSVRVGFGER